MGHDKDLRFCIPQQMSSVPLLLNSNQFSVLEVYEPEVREDTQNTQELPPPVADSRKLCQPKWERRMAHKLVIHSLEQDPRCIMVPIHLKTTDTMEEARALPSPP